MKKSLLPSLVRGLLWTACLIAGPARSEQRWPALREALPVTANLTCTDEPVTGDFDWRGLYRVRGAKDWQAVFLLDGQPDQSGYRLILSEHSSSFSKIQMGLEILLATGSGIGGSRSGELVIRRRENCFRVYADHRLLLTAHDETYGEGLVGYGVTEGDVSFEKILVQPVQPIVFNDDFMRLEAETGDWERVSGSWQVKSLRNPLRSANAFTYLGRSTGGPALSLTGKWFWDAYRFGAAVQGTGSRAVGLIACYQDRNNYLLFEWTGQNRKDAGVKRLIRLRDGKRQILSESRGGYRPGQWYSVSASVNDKDLKASIDGVVVCSASVEPTSEGRAGLYTEDGKGAYFDDVWCESNRDVSVDFRAAGELGKAIGGEWQEFGGNWAVVAEGSGKSVCAVRTASPARALVGLPTWSDYTVSAEVGRVGSGSAGLSFYYQSEDEHLLLRNVMNNPNVIELVKVSGDQKTVVESQEVPTASTGFRELTARVDRNLITAFAEGKKLFEHFDPSLAGGRAGLYAEDCDKAAFGRFSLTFLPKERSPVFTVHEVFGGEVSMANWAAAQSDWTSAKASVAGTGVDCLWHRAAFFGDVEIEAERETNQGSLTLIVGASEQSPGSGYALSADPAALTLSRAGVVAARVAVKPGGDASLVRLRKEGQTLVATVDGVPALNYRDPQPLTGLNVGWYATGAAVKRDSINVYSDQVLTDTFRRATTDWRTEGGEWVVRNRWQCDPRWSFFSGSNFAGPALLWHKREFDGDLTVEFAAGIQMRRDRGTYTDYGRDIDLTLCADGKNVTSGYSFVFAGWRNTKCAIVREGKVVSEAPAPRLDDSIHRKWFLIRVEKRGNQLRYFVDDQLICRYEDPEPLPGKRLALWTYRCGLMLSRFRLCAQKIGERESVDEAWPETSRTFYDEGSR